MFIIKNVKVLTYCQQKAIFRGRVDLTLGDEGNDCWPNRSLSKLPEQIKGVSVAQSCAKLSMPALGVPVNLSLTICASLT